MSIRESVSSRSTGSLRSAALLLLAVVAVPAAAGEVRRVYDARGNLVRELHFDQGALKKEVATTYDRLGRWVEKTTRAGDAVTAQAREYNKRGELIRETKASGGAESLKTYTYDRGQVIEVVEVAGEDTRTTSYTYDRAGHALLVETVGADGVVISRTAADYAQPRVPVDVSASAGAAYASDVDLASVALGFAVSRSPDAALYESDPLEFHLAANYAYGTSLGVVTQNQLDVSTGADLNHLLPRTTFFFFTGLERDPVVNLNMDLVLAPVGVKYDIIDTRSFDLDVSVAPVWNYRSITSDGVDCDGAEAAGEFTCPTSKLRGSLRTKVVLDLHQIKVSDTVEYLPNLIPETDFATALSEDSIFVNTFALDMTLSTRLTLTESFVFKRDLTLAAQVDCDADPDNLLCDGLLYTTATTLTFTFGI